MSKNVFGWDLPPGVTQRMIDESAGADEEQEELEMILSTKLDELGIKTDEGQLAEFSSWFLKKINDSFKIGVEEARAEDAMAKELAVYPVASIVQFLREQADRRALENDEAGMLSEAADRIEAEAKG